MKILFLNEGAFGSYKNKTNKETKKQTIQRETMKIAKRAAREEIGKFYGKVLKQFALIAEPAVKKSCNFNDRGSINFDAATTFDINARTGWGGRSENTYELTDYENIAASLYSTEECLNNNHEDFIIPINIGSDNGFIEDSILNKNVFYKTLIKVFNKCIDQLLNKGEELPLGFNRPKNYKILLLSSYTKNPWYHNGDEVPPIETLYSSIFNGTFSGHLFDIDDICFGKKRNETNVPTYRYAMFLGNKENVVSDRMGRIHFRSAKDLDDVIKIYPKIIFNMRYWNAIDLTTNYENINNTELFDFINECTKLKISITGISFVEDNADSWSGTTNKSVTKGVDRALNVVKLLDKLKDACPGINNTRIDIPPHLSGGGFMINADKKFLVATPDKSGKGMKIDYTSLGKNLGLTPPSGKFIRNIYALDIKSSKLKTDLVNMIRNAANKNNNIDISGKYEATIIEGTADHMIKTFDKLLSLRPHCCAGNYLLFCSYTQGERLDEIIRIGFSELTTVKNNLTIQVEYDFKLACASGFNPRYSASKSQQASGKSYEYIAGKKTRIIIPT